MLKDKNLLEDFNLVEELNDKVSQALSGGVIIQGEACPQFSDGTPAGGCLTCDPAAGEDTVVDKAIPLQHPTTAVVENVIFYKCVSATPAPCDFKQTVLGVEYCCNWDGGGPGPYSCN